jgi:Fibronectin type III domain
MRATTLFLAALIHCASGLLAGGAAAAPRPQSPLPSKPLEKPVFPFSAPANITVSAGTPISATLTWSAVPGAIRYSVARNSRLYGPLDTVTPTQGAQTSLIVTGLAPYMIYYFSVTAIALDGRQATSTFDAYHEIAIRTPPPTNPTGLTATQIGGVVTLTWQPVAGATDYTVIGGAGAQQPGRTVPATQTSFVDYAMNLNSGSSYNVFANFRGTAGTFADTLHPSQLNVTLRGPAPHVPWLTRADPFAGQPDPGGTKHAAEANQYLNAINNGRRTLQQWMGVTGLFSSSSNTLLRAVYFNAGDLNLGRDMSCAQSGQTIACMVSNFAPPVNFFAGDTPDVQTALAGAVQGVHSAANGYLATVAMEVNLAHPDDVKFYVFAGENELGSTVAVLDTEADPQSHLPSGYSPFNCITCHGGSYDTNSHTVTGASFLPFDVYSFKYSQQPGFTQADQEETFRRFNALVKATRPSAPAGTDPIATFIDGMYAGNAAVPGARANDTWVPAGWMTPAPAGPNVYNYVIKPFCRTCHLAMSGDLSFPSYLKFKTPAINPNNNQFLGGQRDQIQAALCGGAMPQAEVPFRKFWQNPTVSWMGYLQDPTVAGMKCN